MLRTFLTTTALAALLASGAIAQDAPATNTMEAPAAEAPVLDAATESLLAEGYAATDSDNLASEIIGKQVYSSTASDAEHIGDVNNLVIDDDGSVGAVIIGVGGFLGIGEKNVAVKFSELEWVVAEDNSERFVLPTTKEALEAAPAFEWTEDEPAADAAAPAADPVAPATDPVAPAADPAAAPATDPVAPAADPAAPAAAPLDRASLQDFDESTLTGDELKGTEVYGLNDERIGTVDDIVLGEDGKTVDALIIDVGGFLGMGAKPVAVAFENLSFSADANNKRFLFINATKDQLESQPMFDRDKYLAERDTQRLVLQP